MCRKKAKHGVYDASNGLFLLFVNDEVHLHVDEARHIEMRLSRRELVAPGIEGGERDVSEGLNNERQAISRHRCLKSLGCECLNDMRDVCDD